MTDWRKALQEYAPKARRNLRELDKLCEILSFVFPSKIAWFNGKEEIKKYLRMGLCDEDKIAYFQSEVSKGKRQKTKVEKELAEKRKEINNDVRKIFNMLAKHMGYDPRQSLDGAVEPVEEKKIVRQLYSFYKSVFDFYIIGKRRHVFYY